MGPPELLQGTEAALSSKDTESLRTALAQYPLDMRVAIDNLKRAHQHGVLLVTGSDAGNYLVIHGPTVQHELQLWVQAGIPPDVALQAATFNAARLLRAREPNRLHPGRQRRRPARGRRESSRRHHRYRRISLVVFKGERIDRNELFDQR